MRVWWRENRGNFNSTYNLHLPRLNIIWCCFVVEQTAKLFNFAMTLEQTLKRTKWRGNMNFMNFMLWNSFPLIFIMTRDWQSRIVVRMECVFDVQVPFIVFCYVFHFATCNCIRAQRLGVELDSRSSWWYFIGEATFYNWRILLSIPCISLVPFTDAGECNERWILS